MSDASIVPIGRVRGRAPAGEPGPDGPDGLDGLDGAGDLDGGVGPDAAEERAALVALAALPGIGPATLLRCRVSGAESAWSAAVAGHPEKHPALGPSLVRMGASAARALVAAARSSDPQELLAQHQSAGRRVLLQGTTEFPERLAEDPAAPAVLFAQGDLTLVDRPVVAIVGTRNATRLGREIAAELGTELAGVGVAVVSGLALGIDGAAHRGTLDAGGHPIGVIASGLDIAYPDRHRALHREVTEAGLLLSETPLGERPSAWRFPARNRIIAGLADAVVVVESRSVGGSMHTVSEALARGITVLAVPGHPRAPAAAGTNDLIFDGAGIVRSPDDVIEAIGLVPSPVVAETDDPPSLSPAQSAVLDAIGELPAALAEIVARSGCSIEVVAEALTVLEADGQVTNAGGWFERSRIGRGAGHP